MSGAIGPSTNRSSRSQTARGVGFVALVGAGPGDPELITLKAVRHLEKADVVLTDALANPALLAHCRSDARVLDVGKLCEGRHTPQEVTNRVLIDEARAGAHVVRLKGGDPFVFGRGGEEAMALSAAGVPHVVVPGISSCVAVPAYSHIPLTHRGVAQHFTVTTATSADDDVALAAQWQLLVHAGGTLVFLMSRRKVAHIAAALIGAGTPETLPAAMIENGTLPSAREVFSTLADIAHDVEAAGLAAPALLVVGKTVSLREQLRPALQGAVPLVPLHAGQPNV